MNTPSNPDTSNTPSIQQAAREQPMRTSLWQALVHAARRRLQAWRRARRCARDIAVLRQLDRASLRDLGIHPSEFASCWAEAEGQAERSRRRIVRTVDRRSPS